MSKSSQNNLKIIFIFKILKKLLFKSTTTTTKKTTTTTSTTMTTAKGKLTNTNTDQLYQTMFKNSSKFIENNLDELLKIMEEISSIKIRINYSKELFKRLKNPDILEQLNKLRRKYSFYASKLTRPMINIKDGIRTLYIIIGQRNINVEKGRLELTAEDFNNYFLLEDILVKINIYLSNFENYSPNKRILCTCNLMNNLCNLIDNLDKLKSLNVKDDDSSTSSKL